MEKHRGMKANGTVRESRAIPQSKTGGDRRRPVMAGDEQGELNWGQIIKVLFIFQNLVFICSPLFSVNNAAENQKSTIRKFHCF